VEVISKREDEEGKNGARAAEIADFLDTNLLTLTLALFTL